MKNIILRALKNPCTLNELSRITSLPIMKVSFYLKDIEHDGISLGKSCTDNGEVKYYINTLDNDKEITINPVNNKVKLLIVSDTHIGRNNDFSCFRLIEQYIKDNDIHISLFIGDLIDGVNDNNVNNYLKLYDQTEKFINNYPFVENHINLYLIGNHDYSALYYNSMDIRNIIDRRKDFIYVGSGSGNIKIMNDIITLRHELILTDMPNIQQGRVIFKGHSHKYAINNNVVIVPALLEDSFYRDILSQGFLEANLEMDDNGYIKNMSLKHLIFDRDVIREVSENILSLPNIKVKKKI